MTRCKQCLTKVETTDERCPVCGVNPLLKWSELAPTERRTRVHARAVRVLAVFHLLLAGYSLIMMPFAPSAGPVAVLALINLALGFGLARFSLIAKKAAVTYYFLIGMVSTISIQGGSVYVGGIFLCLIAIYLVGNGASRAIFERRPPEDA